MIVEGDVDRRTDQGSRHRYELAANIVERSRRDTELMVDDQEPVAGGGEGNRGAAFGVDERCGGPDEKVAAHEGRRAAGAEADDASVDPACAAARIAADVEPRRQEHAVAVGNARRLVVGGARRQVEVGAQGRTVGADESSVRPRAGDDEVDVVDRIVRHVRPSHRPLANARAADREGRALTGGLRIAGVGRGQACAQQAGGGKEEPRSYHQCRDSQRRRSTRGGDGAY